MVGEVRPVGADAARPYYQEVLQHLTMLGWHRWRNLKSDSEGVFVYGMPRVVKGDKCIDEDTFYWPQLVEFLQKNHLAPEYCKLFSSGYLKKPDLNVASNTTSTESNSVTVSSAPAHTDIQTSVQPAAASTSLVSKKRKAESGQPGEEETTVSPKRSANEDSNAMPSMKTEEDVAKLEAVPPELTPVEREQIVTAKIANGVAGSKVDIPNLTNEEQDKNPGDVAAKAEEPKETVKDKSLDEDEQKLQLWKGKCDKLIGVIQSADKELYDLYRAYSTRIFDKTKAEIIESKSRVVNKESKIQELERLVKSLDEANASATYDPDKMYNIMRSMREFCLDPVTNVMKNPKIKLNEMKTELTAEKELSEKRSRPAKLWITQAVQTLKESQEHINAFRQQLLKTFQEVPSAHTSS